MITIEQNKGKTLRIGLVVGEASGDLLGAHLMRALKSQYADIEFVGIAGPKMLAEGCLSLYEQEVLAVRGFVEVIKRLPAIWRVRQGLLAYFKANPVDVFIGIDAPDFNFGIEKKLKKEGVKTIHYVSPSVWAWRGGRVKKIVTFVDKVLCLFPIEPPLYQEAGGQAVFVGHPLAETIPMHPDKEAARLALNIAINRPVFALMPGSRVSELAYMLSCFLDTARGILQECPDAQFLLPIATKATRDYLESVLAQEIYQDLPITVLYQKAQESIVASDVVLVASGTASLEVALCKRPMVISYRISPVTFLIVKACYQLPYIGLPNILMKHFLVPELLQKDATPKMLTQALMAWYQDPKRIADYEQECETLHGMLKQDTAHLAAKAVLDMVGISK